MEKCVEEFQDHSQLLGSGVYALKFHGRVIYVGKAKCLLIRVEKHRQMWSRHERGKIAPPWLPPSAKGMKFDEILTIPCHVDKMDALETHYIQLYKPKYNVQKKTSGPVTTPFALNIRGITVGINHEPVRMPSESVARRRVA